MEAHGSVTWTAHHCHSDSAGLTPPLPYLGMKGSRNSVCPLDQHVVTMENQIRPSSLGTPRKLMVWFPLQAPEPLSLFLPSSPFLTSFLTLPPLRYWTVHTLEKHWWPHSQSWSQGLSSRLYPAPAGPDSDSDSELSLDEHSSSYASSHTSDSEDDGGEAEDKWNPAGGPAHSTPKGKQWRHADSQGDCEQWAMVTPQLWLCPRGSAQQSNSHTGQLR